MYLNIDFNKGKLTYDLSSLLIKRIINLCKGLNQKFQTFEKVYDTLNVFRSYSVKWSSVVIVNINFSIIFCLLRLTFSTQHFSYVLTSILFLMPKLKFQYSTQLCVYVSKLGTRTILVIYISLLWKCWRLLKVNVWMFNS